MLGAMRAFSQVAINRFLCSPFVLGGANTLRQVGRPRSVAQLNAEALSALAYTQVDPASGAPAIYGHYLSTVSA